jgi:hypothetical protein
MRETTAEGAVRKVEIYATSYRKLHKRKSLESAEESRTKYTVITP